LVSPILFSMSLMTGARFSDATPHPCPFSTVPLRILIFLNGATQYIAIIASAAASDACESEVLTWTIVELIARWPSVRHLFLPHRKLTCKNPQTRGAKVVGDFAPPFGQSESHSVPASLCSGRSAPVCAVRLKPPKNICLWAPISASFHPHRIRYLRAAVERGFLGNPPPQLRSGLQ